MLALFLIIAPPPPTLALSASMSGGITICTVQITINGQKNNTGDASTKNTILFNCSKKELFLPSSGYKTLQSRLKVHWAVGLQRDDLTPEKLSSAKLIVFGGPRDKFSTSEVCLYVAILTHRRLYGW